ncbi:Reverse transcriptase Ty1/copia-type domain-containing protein [Abeliophyllum distichum]|uniref:Reverse transcriptase Ty1/copia-type domain-containing protein n=1 Tax=Abeliophyllum distichum TaxID=126358 RepID=A0ABD1PS77_9LAMI
MDPSVDLETNLDNFSKLSQDLASCGEKFFDEHQAIILLNALLDTFKDVRNAIEYGRDSLTTEIVVNSLRTKNLDIQQQNLNSVKGEGLNVRGRSLTRQNGHYDNHQNGKKRNFKELRNHLAAGVETIRGGSWRVATGTSEFGDHCVRGDWQLGVVWATARRRDGRVDWGEWRAGCMARWLVALATARRRDGRVDWTGDLERIRFQMNLASATVQSTLPSRLLAVAHTTPSCQSPRTQWSPNSDVPVATRQEPPRIISTPAARHEKKNDFFLTIADNDLEKPNPHSEIEVESDNNQAQTGLEEFDDISPDSAIEHDLPVPDDSNLRDYQLARDRVRRNIREPQRLGFEDSVSFAFLSYQDLCEKEPKSFEEAMSSVQPVDWKNAMVEEMKFLKQNKTWELVSKPKYKSIVDCKWIYKVKEGVSESGPIRFKVRLVAKGFTQNEGVDYNEIFSPVVKYTTIRLMLALVAHFNRKLDQLDVKTVFLHGELDEMIYMNQPPGFKDKQKPTDVCLLRKSLYDLKQFPRQWYKRFDTFVLSLNFKRSDYDHCLYYKCERENNISVYLLLYVDDMLLISSCANQIKRLKSDLFSEFDMKDLGNAKRILGMEIIRNKDLLELKLNQTPYIHKILDRFAMSNAKEVNIPLGNHFIISKDNCPKSKEQLAEMKNVPYSNAIGSIIYSMVCTKPDVAHSISVLSSYMSNPGPSHWEALKCWKSQLQHIMALSTTESEYVAITEAVKEALWLKGILKELGYECTRSYEIKLD